MNKLIAYMLVAVIVLAFLVGFLVGFPGLTAVSVNPTTQRIANAGWEGAGATGGTIGELLDDDDYIASWSPDLVGQRVTAQGALQKSGGALVACIADRYKYQVTLWTSSLDKATVMDTDAEWPGNVGYLGGWEVLPSVNWDIKSQTKVPVPDGSKVRAEFWIHCAFGSWVPMSADEARIYSGIGSVSWTKTQYAVGETAALTWTIPYASDDATGKGWSVYVYGSAQNKDVVPLTKVGVGGSLRGEVRYTVTIADFSVASGCRNELTAILRNELWDKSFDTTTTIDVSAFAPTVKITSYEPDHPQQGDTVTVRWDVIENPTTKLPIEKILVKYGFGGIEKEQELSASARDYSFVAGSAGQVHVEVIAYDSGCRPSPTDEVYIQVGEPNAPATVDWLLIAFVLIIALVLAAFVAYFVPGGVFVKGIAVIAVLTVAGVLVYAIWRG